MRLLKFVKGQFLSGDNEVPAGREFIAHANQLAHGYTKFVGGKVAEQRMGLVADPTFVLPERADLGDTDQSTWETDHNSKPRDPWTRQYYLPLEDNETGELYTFVTGSQGGNSAIGKLLAQYVRNAHLGVPLIELVAGSYRHKQFGPVPVPEFKVTAWTSGPVSHEPPPYDGPTYDMDGSF